MVPLKIGSEENILYRYLNTGTDLLVKDFTFRAVVLPTATLMAYVL